MLKKDSVTRLTSSIPVPSLAEANTAGGAAYSPALTDFIIMTRQNAQMFICGPEVIKASTGQVTTMDEIGSAHTHAAIGGNVHFIAEDEQHALQIAKRLFSFLSSNNVGDPPTSDH